MYTRQWIMLPWAVLSLILGCAAPEDASLDATGEWGTDQSAATTSAVFSGTVTNEQGTVLAGATVTINGIARSTDSTGKYFVSISGSTNGYILNVSKPGFAPSTTFSSAGMRNNTHVLASAFVQQINPATDTLVTSNTGVRVSIRANTLVDAAGAPATGPVTITVASYNPLRMPGDMTAVNASGAQVALESVGAATITATNSRGASLNLRGGATAEGFIPLPPQLGRMPPCIFDGSCRLAMWRFNATTGKWQEKSAGMVVSSTGIQFTMMGGSSTASVSPLAIVANEGFGTWNADVEMTSPACTIVEFRNFPLECYNPSNAANEPGIQVNLKLPNSAGTLISRTDRALSASAFLALYNIRANALQEVGIAFPAGAPAYCAGNLTITSTPAPAASYPTFSATGGVTRFNSGAPWGGTGFPRNARGLLIDFNDVSGSSHPCRSTVTFETSSAPVGPLKTAMTWSLLASAAPNSAHAYALVGSDSRTNPYQGDTLTNQMLPVLCIKKNQPPYPGSGTIGSPVQTPGGAWRRSWSGGTIALTAPVKGNTLLSRTAADAFCASQFGTGYRMAEFHDGDPTLWSGWDFWGEALNANLTPFRNTRFWVSINDQNANPW